MNRHRSTYNFNIQIIPFFKQMGIKRILSVHLLPIPLMNHTHPKCPYNINFETKFKIRYRLELKQI